VIDAAVIDWLDAERWRLVVLEKCGMLHCCQALIDQTKYLRSKMTDIRITS
jgi:hypothetical protein